MNQQEVRKRLVEIGALVENGHIVDESWMHTNTDIDKKMLYLVPQEAYIFCETIAKWFADDNVDVVIGPKTCGRVLARWTAHYLTKLYTGEKRKIVAEACAERWLGKRKTFVIRRRDGKNISPENPLEEDNILCSGEDIITKNVMVVDDILYTGGTTRNVVEAVRSIGGNVVGVGVFCNLGGVTLKDIAGVPKLVSLLDITRKKWTEKECPKCKQGIPINKSVGKGLEFISRKQIQAS